MKFYSLDLIQRKRDGAHLSVEEIEFWVQGVVDGSIPDYQISAFLMAIFFQDMALDETVALTRSMRDSGKVFDLSAVKGPKIDKHSTGGVGDKVSLILAPLAAACGLKVPMMAGRGLGHSGGTIDKLESIPGYRTTLSESEFVDVLQDVGCSIISQSAEVAPADRKLYAMRDVTATIDCVPLITASILSKKLASGTQGLVMDLKTGNGAFMKTRAQAQKLARSLLHVSKKLGLACKIVISDMGQPLGYAAGNALEVIECIEVLRGTRNGDGDRSSTDLKALTVHLVAQMLLAGKITTSLTTARRLATEKLESGAAWEVFRRMVEAHGGDVAAIDDPKGLPQARESYVWRAPKSGYLTAIDTKQIGELVVDLGGGRRRLDDSIDFGTGLVFHRKLGARLKVGEPVMTAWLNSADQKTRVDERMKIACLIQSQRKPIPRLILQTL